MEKPSGLTGAAQATAVDYGWHRRGLALALAPPRSAGMRPCGAVGRGQRTREDPRQV